MRRLLFSAVAATALMFGLSTCGDDDAGICIADMGIVVECFDCWSQELCEESSSRTWNPDLDSCEDAGYTSPTSNECGYTQ